MAGLSVSEEQHVPRLQLNDGNSIPQLGLGTWLATPDEVYPAVRDALDIGYRHLDCAHIYRNQEAVGRAISEFLAANKDSVARSDLFVTSKIWSTFHSAARATEAIEIILSQLQLDYVDLLLIHWPMGYLEGNDLFPRDEHKQFIDSGVDYVETWHAMEDAVRLGKVRSIGLSNFNSVQIERVLKAATIKPALLQIELHPYLQQKQLAQFCRENDIAVVAYSSLFNANHEFKTDDQPNLLADATILDIAKQTNRTSAQVALRWAIQRGFGVIPKSTRKARILENFQLFDFSLNNDQMEKIDKLDRKYRLLTLVYDKAHPHNPFKIPF